MSYHAIPRRYAVTPGIGAFQKESGELTDLPEGQETSVLEPCPGDMKAVVSKTGEHSEMEAIPYFEVVGCVQECPSGFVERLWVNGKRGCMLREDMAELEQSVRHHIELEERRDQETKAKATTAAVVAGGSALALLAFLL